MRQPAQRSAQQPTEARPLAEGPARAEGLPAAAAMAARPEAFARAAALAVDSEARSALLEQLAQPEQAASAARLLASFEGRDLLARTFAVPPAVRTGDPAEIRALSAALRILARSSMEGLADAVLTSQAARAALAQVLARVSPPLPPPGPSPAPSPAAAPASGDATVSEEMGTILQTLARPDMLDAARTLFSSPEARAALTGAFAALQSAEAAAVPQLSRSDTAVLLNILSQPPMAEIARQAFSTTEARAILARVLAMPLGPSAGAGAASAEADAQAALRILARPGMADAARDVFSRPEVQARVPDLLALPETRTATLDILMRPELRGGSVREAVVPHAVTAQLFARADVADAVARAALASPRAAAQTAALLQRPETAAPFLEALARNGTPEALARWAAQPEVAGALADLPPALRTLLLALSTPGAGGLVSPESVAAALESLFASRGNALSGAAIAALAGSAVAGSVGSAPGGAVLAGAPPAEATLGALTDALARLANVSPERAQNLAGVLAILAQLDSANTDAVLGQLAHRLDAQAAALALKGGLPPDSPEPPLADSLILSLRFGETNAAQLADIVRALARQGGEILFIGRDGKGQVQIQFLAAELLAGRGGNGGSGAQPGALPGALADSQTGAALGLGLYAPDGYALRADDGSHLGAPGNPLVIANLRPADLAALGLPLGPHHANQQPGDSRSDDGSGSERGGSDSHRAPFQELAALENRIVREAAPPAEILATTRLTQLLAGRQADLLATPQIPGSTHFTFPYERAAAGVFVPTGAPPTTTAARRDGGGPSGKGQEEAIPSLLDLIALDPPLLRYEPTELFVPGTWIPLILPPDKAVDVAWTALD